MAVTGLVPSLSLFNLIWCQSITLPFLPLPAHPSGSWVPGGPASLFSEEFSSLAIILVGSLGNG